MIRGSFTVLFLAILATSLGCTPAASLPPTAKVKGTVTLDGQPLQQGEVVFTVPGEPESRLPVANGSYSGDAYVGNNKVGVFSYKESAPTSGLSTDTVQKTNIVADRHSFNTTFTANVTADGANEFTFDAATK